MTTKNRSRDRNLVSTHYKQLNGQHCIESVETGIIRCCVYFITDGEYTKIGMTKNLVGRFSVFQIASPKELTTLGVCLLNNTQETIECEKRFHEYFLLDQVRGEWYDVSREEILSASEALGYKLYEADKYNLVSSKSETSYTTQQ